MSKLIILVSSILCVLCGTLLLNNHHYVMISLVVLCLAVLPFLAFLNSKTINTKELIVISSLAAIAVVGRGAFYWLPQFKPVTAIIIVSAVELGSREGFLIGCMSAFLSNFLFGQGPWTPYQMLSWGIIGYIAGAIFRHIRINKWTLSIYGFLSCYCIYGLIMNFASMFMFGTEFNFKILLSFYVTGFPMDTIHACSTVFFLYFVTNPLKDKLDRIKKKYRLFE